MIEDVIENIVRRAVRVKIVDGEIEANFAWWLAALMVMSLIVASIRAGWLEGGRAQSA